MKEALISVIVPAYNIQDYIERCIRSIQNQTYQNIEILVVDDGSTDRTGEILDGLAVEDSRLRIFHKKNGGSSAARNMGIDNARGEYLAFVDSDDYIEEDMLESMHAYLLETGLSIVECGRDEVAEDGSKLPDVCVPFPQKTIIPAKTFLREMLLHRGDCSFCTKLIHRSYFDGVRFPDGKLNEDFYVMIQFLSKYRCDVGSIPERKYHVFYKSNSNTRVVDRTVFPRVFTDIVENADLAMEVVKTQYPDLTKEARRFGFYQRLEYLLHIPIRMMTKDNAFYKDVVKHIRKGVFAMWLNPYLARKNKVYLTLFAISPRGIRTLHAKHKGFTY